MADQITHASISRQGEDKRSLRAFVDLELSGIRLEIADDLPLGLKRAPAANGKRVLIPFDLYTYRFSSIICNSKRKFN